MTKEEILFPLHQHCPEETERVYSHENAVQAMDTYARQEAMEYCRWIKMVAYYMPAKERWYFFPNDLLYNKEGHTDDELYDLYQKQKMK